MFQGLRNAKNVKPQGQRMSDPLMQNARMRLNPVFIQTQSSHVIQHFGGARLVKHANGTHELLGGSAADLTAAKEWASLFAHDLVFSQPNHRRTPSCRSLGEAKNSGGQRG